MVNIPVMRNHLPLDCRPFDDLGRHRPRGRGWAGRALPLPLPLDDTNALLHLHLGGALALALRDEADPVNRATAGFPHDAAEADIVFHPPRRWANAPGPLNDG
jgi:hypothetical protein